MWEGYKRHGTRVAHALSSYLRGARAAAGL
jgi:hypothetical protein